RPRDAGLDRPDRRARLQPPPRGGAAHGHAPGLPPGAGERRAPRAVRDGPAPPEMVGGLRDPRAPPGAHALGASGARGGEPQDPLAPAILGGAGERLARARGGAAAPQDRLLLE